MELEIRDKEKRVYIWLTRSESENCGTKESLKAIYQKYKGKGYLVAVFESGTEDLERLTRDLLVYNRIRLRELEKEKAAAN